MADETPMSPISEAVPPKANPLATPATAHTATVKLKPGIKLPAKPGLPAGLKLPTKPGLPAGLKLPPKAGATVSGLKPGVRLPTQTALKPGIKLPTRPVIRKPGATVKAPVQPVPAVAKPPAAEPAKPVEAAAAVEMTPVAPAVEQPKPLEALKTVTQNLKSITSPIPQQAILRKTGIIADAEMTEAQKQAAKSKTARISLSDAMGVAPVKNEAQPMKTIRIKRPVDIPGATSQTTPVPPSATPSAPSATPSATPSAPSATQAPAQAADTAASTAFTQRKTIKISRPDGKTVRPASSKFGVRRPATSAAKPAASAAPTGDVADIPDIPSAQIRKPVAAGEMVPDVPKGVATAGLIIQIAACLVMAFLGWLLVENAQLPPYCGGLGM